MGALILAVVVLGLAALGAACIWFSPEVVEAMVRAQRWGGRRTPTILLIFRVEALLFGTMILFMAFRLGLLFLGPQGPQP